jgi:hypothetical protein
VPRSWRPELLAGALCGSLLLAQGVTPRLDYDVRVVGAAGVLARGKVSGPQDTDLRITLRSESVQAAVLLNVTRTADSTFTLVGDFFTQRMLSRSRRGLPLWEEDTYQRTADLSWGDTARVFLLGKPAAAADSLWVEVAVQRSPSGAVLKPSETTTIEDSTIDVTFEAVARPRRTVVWLTLVRGDTASPPRRLDLLVDAAARTLELPVGARARRRLALAIVRPEAPRAARDRVLALDADVVCLRVTDPAADGPVRTGCGRLNNVAQRLPLDGTDTLVVNFAWPAAR